MPAIFRIRQRFEELWTRGEQAARGQRDERDRARPEVVEQVGKEIEKQTGRKVELSSTVDEDVLGGLVLRVGNMVLDASLTQQAGENEAGDRPRVRTEEEPN